MKPRLPKLRLQWQMRQRRLPPKPLMPIVNRSQRSTPSNLLRKGSVLPRSPKTLLAFILLAALEALSLGYLVVGVIMALAS